MTRITRLFRTLAVAIATACAITLLAPSAAGAYAGAATISGTVSLSSDGVTAPAGNASIYLWYWSAFDDEWVSTGGNHWVAGDGSFTIVTTPGEYKLQAIVPGAPDTFWGGSLDAQAAPSFTVGADEQRTGMDIRADAYGSIGGRVEVVRSPGGTAETLQNGYAFFWRLDPSTGAFEVIVGGSTNVYEGSFLWPDLISGTYVVEVAESASNDWVPQHGYYSDARYFEDAARIELAAGEDIDLGLLTLQPRTYDVARLAGSDRFATAVEVTKTIFPDDERPPVVYLANGHNFPDALAAGPAAIRQGGAILTTPADGLPAVVGEELGRLDPARVVIVGGTAAVSTLVEDEVERMLPSAEVDRLGGADRYETAELIVRDAAGASDRSYRYAFVATGANFPDALAAAPAAAEYDAPVVLVPSGPIGDRVSKLIQDLEVDEVVIVGGEASVGRDTADSLAAVPEVQQVRRVAGADRYQTAVEINAQFLGYGDHAVVATGEAYADALAGAPLAGALGAPMYLARPGCMTAAAMHRIEGYHVSAIWLLGGPNALSPAVAELQPLC